MFQFVFMRETVPEPYNSTSPTNQREILFTVIQYHPLIIYFIFVVGMDVFSTVGLVTWKTNW